jgi:hypothetical protein
MAKTPDDLHLRLLDDGIHNPAGAPTSGQVCKHN